MYFILEKNKYSVSYNFNVDVLEKDRLFLNINQTLYDMSFCSSTLQIRMVIKVGIFPKELFSIYIEVAEGLA